MHDDANESPYLSLDHPTSHVALSFNIDTVDVEQTLLTITKLQQVPTTSVSTAPIFVQHSCMVVGISQDMPMVIKSSIMRRIAASSLYYLCTMLLVVVSSDLTWTIMGYPAGLSTAGAVTTVQNSIAGVAFVWFIIFIPVVLSVAPRLLCLKLVHSRLIRFFLFCIRRRR